MFNALPDISAIGEDGVVKTVARDKKNDTSNDFSIVVGETDKKFTFNFKEENLKIITWYIQCCRLFKNFCLKFTK